MSHFKKVNSSAIEVVSIQSVKYIKWAQMQNILIYNWKSFLKILKLLNFYASVK